MNIKGMKIRAILLPIIPLPLPTVKPRARFQSETADQRRCTRTTRMGTTSGPPVESGGPPDSSPTHTFPSTYTHLVQRLY